MSQIESRVPLQKPRGEAKVVTRADSEVVRKGVFSKTTKETVAVRKYAIIDTHKGDDRNFAPLCVYFTDYSPGRKEPLKTALRTASTMENAERQVTDWLANNIKRGWGEVESSRVGEPVEAPPDVVAILAKAKG